MANDSTLKRAEIDWRTQAEAFYLRLADFEVADQAAVILSTYDFLSRILGKEIINNDWLPERSLIEKLTAAEAFETAALHLMPSASGFMISRGPLGIFVATVVLNEGGIERTFEESTMAYAIIGALLLVLIDDSAPSE